MKTLIYRIITGIEVGYGHDRAGIADKETVNKTAAIWQKLAAAEFEKSGIYISAAVSPGAVVYHRDWGCPHEGETVVQITGSANPQFVQNLNEWKNAVLKIAQKLKEELKQTTLSIEFWESDFIYLTD